MSESVPFSHAVRGRLRGRLLFPSRFMTYEVYEVYATNRKLTRPAPTGRFVAHYRNQDGSTCTRVRAYMELGEAWLASLLSLLHPVLVCTLRHVIVQRDVSGQLLMALRCRFLLSTIPGGKRIVFFF